MVPEADNEYFFLVRDFFSFFLKYIFGSRATLSVPFLNNYRIRRYALNIKHTIKYEVHFVSTLRMKNIYD